MLEPSSMVELPPLGAPITWNVCQVFMRDPRINLRNRELAAFLAFILPGGGHFYQGRRLKAGIYFTGIVSLFFAGMILGDWQPVYSQIAYINVPGSVQMRTAQQESKTSFSIGYAAQVFVGFPAFPSLIQQFRFKADPGSVVTLDGPLRADFIGAFREAGVFVPVSGSLSLVTSTQVGVTVEGHFSGVTKDGVPVEAELRGGVRLGQKVFGSPRRDIIISGLEDVLVGEVRAVELRGTVTRSFSDWYQAPRDSGELDRLHGKLSRHFEIACVFTWIAGLLNLMAIWDAYDGPAYGYGDERPEDDEDDSDSKTKAAEG